MTVLQHCKMQEEDHVGHSATQLHLSLCQIRQVQNRIGVVEALVACVLELECSRPWLTPCVCLKSSFPHHTRLQEACMQPDEVSKHNHTD